MIIKTLASYYKNKDFVEGLINCGGYIVKEDVDAAIEVFGENFSVVCKDFHDNRNFLTLFEVKNNLPEDVREVFTCSNDYRTLKSEIENIKLH